jgi:hypothetical protein
VDASLFLIMVIVGTAAGWLGMQLSRYLRRRRSQPEEKDE